MDTIFLRDLRIRTIVGENDALHRLAVIVQFTLPGLPAVYYGNESGFNLIETMAERIAALIIDEFGAPWVRVAVHKPGAIRGSRDVGVVIERGSRE